MNDVLQYIPQYTGLTNECVLDKVCSVSMLTSTADSKMGFFAHIMRKDSVEKQPTQRKAMGVDWQRPGCKIKKTRQS